MLVFVGKCGPFWLLQAPGFPGVKRRELPESVKVSGVPCCESRRTRQTASEIIDISRGTTGQREGSGGAGEEPGAAGSSPAAPPVNENHPQIPL